MTSVYTSPEKRHFDFTVGQGNSDAKVKTSLSEHLTKTLLISLRDMDKEMLSFILKGL